MVAIRTRAVLRQRKPAGRGSRSVWIQLHVRQATALFDLPDHYTSTASRPQWANYDVSPDSKKFLMIKNAQAAGPAERPSLTIVTHWLDELKTRVK